jgi:hypothetical protein
MRRRRIAPHSSQVSVRFFSAEERSSKGRDYFDQMYPRMFIEDVTVGLMPIRGRSERRQFDACLLPRGQAAERAIAEALGGRHDWDLGPALCDFVRDCGQIIMAYGRAVYEIVYLSETAGAAPSAFRLESIRSRTVVRKGNGFVQRVPTSVAEEQGVPEELPLPSDRLLIFEPKVYADRKVGQVLESLGVLSASSIPDFVFAERMQGPFDFSVYHRSQKEAMAEATRAIGWNARRLLTDDLLEHYWMQRQLMFEEFKIQLRDEILASLSEGLERVGRILGFSGQLEVSGLPAAVDARRARTALMKGEGAFKDIMSSVSL